MVNSINRRRRSCNVRELPILERYEGELVAWWYGGLKKNRRAESEPLVVVFFRKLERGDILGDFVPISIPITNLAFVRIGSIWLKGKSGFEVELPTQQYDVDFFVDFTEGSWNFVSPIQSFENHTRSPIDKRDYPLKYATDRNWLIDLPIDDGKNLLIPCIEFFSRCYGRSKEVKRILVTHQWDQATRCLYAPPGSDYQPSLGQWPVKLEKRLYNDDAVLVAHIIHDKYTELAAKYIYSQIEKEFLNDESMAFIQVCPWFQGPAQIRVNGMWINGNRTFLGLQVVGCSDPGGATILRDRQNTNKVKNPAAGTDVPTAWRGITKHHLQNYTSIINLTGSDEPDHGAAVVEIKENDFIVLGDRREVVDAIKQQASSKAGKIRGSYGTEAFSGGESYGSGKNVGFASIHAISVMESQGTLRDMWNALLNLKKQYPAVIQAIEWFTFEDGFRSDKEPCLITLRPFGKQAHVSTTTRKWPYLDPDKGILRGVLVTRLTCGNKFIYIFEIQRRLRTDKDKNESEEPFQGYVFMLDDDSLFCAWLRLLLLEVRNVRGIVYKLVEFCPGKADSFNHPHPKKVSVACETAAINALSKIGIQISPIRPVLVGR